MICTPFQIIMVLTWVCSVNIFRIFVGNSIFEFNGAEKGFLLFFFNEGKIVIHLIIIHLDLFELLRIVFTLYEWVRFLTRITTFYFFVSDHNLLQFITG